MFHVEHRPSVLLRSWIRREYEQGRLKPAALAKAVGVKPGAIHNWLAENDRGISDAHWPAIARFFGFPTPEALLAAARDAFSASQERSAGADAENVAPAVDRVS